MITHTSRSILVIQKRKSLCFTGQCWSRPFDCDLIFSDHIGWLLLCFFGCESSHRMRNSNDLLVLWNEE